MQKLLVAIMAIVILAPPLQHACAQFSNVDLEFFESKVRPILVDRCAECHSGDLEQKEGGFSIGSRKSILQGGDSGPAVVPGRPDDSLLIESVRYGGIYEMPPSSKLPLTEIKILERWVALNAPWPEHVDQSEDVVERFDLQKRREEHWAWHSIQRPSIPKVALQDWPQNPIDNFILKRLEDRQMKPSEQAGLRTWFRRVHFDLIGLPPKTDDVERFLLASAENPKVAKSKLVEQLLKSPRFGEHWARHWMDLTRYAETYGHEFDYPIKHAYEYRDYLIRAFNADVPYDQLIREHIAGDLLEVPRLHPEEKFNESVIGTGFWFLGEQTHGPVDVKADEAGRIDNQIDVMCKTFLGLTVACARCHDHKFDAISAKDYYALSGFLQSSRRQIALLDPQKRIADSIKKTDEIIRSLNQRFEEWLADLQAFSGEQWSEILSATDTRSGIDLDSMVRDERLKSLTNPLSILKQINEEEFNSEAIVAAKLFDEKQRADYQRFIDETTLFQDFSQGIPDDWFVSGWAFGESLSSIFDFESDTVIADSTISSGVRGGKYWGGVRSPTFELTHDKILVRCRGMKTQIRLIIDGYEMDIYNPLLFVGCKFDLSSPHESKWVELGADIKNYRGHRAYLEFLDHDGRAIQVDQIRFANQGHPQPIDPPAFVAETIFSSHIEDFHQFCDVAGQAIEKLLNSNEKRYDLERSELLSLLLRHSSMWSLYSKAKAKLKGIHADYGNPKMVVGMADGTPEDEFLFIRGNSKMLGEQVGRRFLSAMTHCAIPEDELQHSSGRVGLAESI
ncbi:MAG: DUF1549 domain-containing protein, partial [Planctomycetota bacterium]